jgi:hypothetical protein
MRLDDLPADARSAQSWPANRGPEPDRANSAPGLAALRRSVVREHPRCELPALSPGVQYDKVIIHASVVIDCAQRLQDVRLQHRHTTQKVHPRSLKRCALV